VFPVSPVRDRRCCPAQATQSDRGIKIDVHRRRRSASSQATGSVVSLIPLTCLREDTGDRADALHGHRHDHIRCRGKDRRAAGNSCGCQRCLKAGDVGAAKRAALDLRVSPLAEHEVTQLIVPARAIAARLEVKVEHGSELAELEKDVVPEQVLDSLEKREAADTEGRLRPRSDHAIGIEAIPAGPHRQTGGASGLRLFQPCYADYFCAAVSRRVRILSWAVLTSADWRATMSLIGVGRSFSIASW